MMKIASITEDENNNKKKNAPYTNICSSAQTFILIPLYLIILMFTPLPHTRFPFARRYENMQRPPQKQKWYPSLKITRRLQTGLLQEASQSSSIKRTNSNVKSDSTPSNSSLSPNQPIVSTVILVATKPFQFFSTKSVHAPASRVGVLTSNLEGATDLLGLKDSPARRTTLVIAHDHTTALKEMVLPLD